METLIISLRILHSFIIYGYLVSAIVFTYCFFVLIDAINVIFLMNNFVKTSFENIIFISSTYIVFILDVGFSLLQNLRMFFFSARK